MGKTMTKDEFYKAVADFKDKGNTDEDVFNILFECLLEKKAGMHEIKRYARWLGYRIDAKTVRRNIKAEMARREKEGSPMYVLDSDWDSGEHADTAIGEQSRIC